MVVITETPYISKNSLKQLMKQEVKDTKFRKERREYLYLIM